MGRASVYRAILVAALGSACAPAKPPSNKPEPPTEAADSEPRRSGPSARSPEKARVLYPRIELDVQNLWADEGEDWGIVVYTDGSFERVHTWSDGADDYVTTCRGSLARELVDPWMDRLKEEATVERPVELSGPEAEAQGLLFTVAYVVDEHTRTFADVRPWARPLEAWFVTLTQAEGECSERPL